MTYQLTRIKNNQITDSTILANTKIVPGSIVGSLFNSNLTMTSDVTITGNLTVQGASTYLTVASTNTYVNDPLIILNNAFSGTNTYDIGLLFNRGASTATALIWNEDNDEFRLVYTTDDGSTYGTINNSGYGNLHIGNLIVETASSFGSISLTGDIDAANVNLTGDLLVGGGDLTANTSSFNLLNTTVTAANVLGDATTINLGASSGNLNVNNANLWLPNATSVDSGQATVTAFSTPTTLTLGASSTTLNLGSSTGVASLNNANIWMPNATTIDGSQASIGLFGNATAVDAFLGATDLVLGATTGNTIIRNALTQVNGNATVGGTFGVTGETTLTANLSVNGGKLDTTASEFRLLEVVPTLYIGGDATTVEIGATTGVANIRNSTTNIEGNAAVTGTLSVASGTLSTSASTFDLANTTATTVNFAGDATTVNIGATTGNTKVRNNLIVDQTVSARDINGTVIGNLTPAAATFSQLDVSTATDTAVPYISGTQFVYDAAFNFDSNNKILEINQVSIDGTNNAISSSTGDLNLSSASGSIFVGNARIKDVADPTDLQDAVTLNYLNQQISSAVTNIQSDDSDISILDDGVNPGQIISHVDTVEVFNISSSVATFYSNLVTLDNANTTVSVNGNVSVTDDLAVDGGDLTTTATTFNLVDTTATTVNFAGDATTLDIGASTGTATINNQTVILPNATNVYVTQTTLAFANENVDNVDAFGAATTLTLSATTGNTYIRNNLNLDATTESSGVTSGALVVDGGVGIAANLNVGGNVTVTHDVVVQGNLTVEGTTTTLNTNTLDVEDLNITVAKGAGSSTAADGAGLTVDGAGATLTYTHLTTSWDLNKTTRITDTSDATDNTTGAVQVLGGLGVAKSIYARDINGTVIGNVSPESGYFTNLTSTGNTSLGLTEATAINNTPIGNAIPSTAHVTSLDASGVVQFTDSTEATAVGTGALRVTGGASIGANLFIGGNVNFVGSSYVLTGNYGVFYGDLNGFGALYAGVTGYTTVPSTVFQTSADINDYAQNNFENVNTGNKASTDWVATAGDGDDYDHYINMGITTNNWDGTQDNSLTNAVGGNDGYLYVQGNVTTGAGGNLTIGASAPGAKTVKVIVGGNTASNITAVFRNPETASTTTSTGALTVAGGVGITGNLNANNISATSSLSATDLTLAGDLAVNGGDLTTTATDFNLINDTATTANIAGAATTLNIGATSGTINVRNTNINLPNATDIYSGQTDIDLFAVNTTSANLLTSATTLNVGSTSGTVTLNNPTVVGSQTTVDLWNTTTTTVNFAGAATTLNVGSTSGTVTLNNPTVVGSQTTVDLWNTTSTTVNFAGAATTVNIGADSGTATINNDTVNLEGNVNVNKTTESTDSTTGALVVDGGVGIAGNLNTNSLVRFTDTTASTQYNNGAVVLGGGLGVAGNINIKADQYLSVGAELTSGKIPNTIAEFNTSANIGAAISIRNVSNASAASSSFTALADDHLDGGIPRAFAFGIAGSGFDEGTIITPNDAYVFNQSGNIYVGTQTAGKNLGFVIGGNTSSSLTATVTSSGIDVHATTPSTSTTSGALTVAGGVAVSGNIWVEGGAVINDGQTADNFTVKGGQTTSLIHADSVYGAVIIGGSNASPQLGATLKVNSTDSILIPVGATAERPSNSGNVDVAGMIRFNTSSSTLEFYTGSQWSSAGSDTTYTIISNEQFTGNGSANTYVLSRNTTTSGAVVSINGILQIPTLAYSITDDILEFTENPADGDLIDVRILTTTQTVGDVTSPNGLNTFTPDDTNGAAIYSGATLGNKAIRATATPQGAWAYVNGTKTTYDQTAVNVASASTPIVVDSFVSSEYSTAKYVVQIKQGGSNVQIMEALVAHDGANAYVTTYGIVDTNGDMGDLTANIVSGNVRLYYTSSSVTNSNVKVYTTYIV